MKTNQNPPELPALYLPTSTTLAKIALEAASVATTAAELSTLPCDTDQQADALLALLAPKAPAGQIVKRVADARMEITRELDSMKSELIAYERELIAPLVEAVEASRERVKAHKDRQIAANKKAEADRMLKLADLDEMQRELVSFWEAKRRKAMSIQTLDELLDMKAKVDAYAGVPNAPQRWVDKGLGNEYLDAADDQLNLLRRLLAEIADNWDNPEGRPMYVEPVATPTLSVAKVATLMEAPAEVIQKGMQTVLKPVVKDWRKVDAVGLVAALINDPIAVAMLEKLLTKLPKGAQVLGVQWVEESRLVAR